MAKQILSVGDLVLDMIFPVHLPIEVNAHQEARQRWVEPGGAGNFLIAARNMGLDVFAAGAVGDDVFGKQIISTLKSFDINTTSVVAVQNSSTTLVLALTDQQSGEHVFVGSYGDGESVPYPRQLDDNIKIMDAVFFQGYSMAEDRMVMMCKDAILQAKAFSVPVYMDVGPQMRQVSPEDVDWLVFHADYIFLTEDEIDLIGGDRDRDETIAYILEEETRLLIVKRGIEGCTIISPEEVVDVPGYPASVIDTVGAGDCFDAAFISAHLSGYSLEDCGKIANAMGSAVVQRVGAGTNAPTLAEVNQILADHNQNLEYKTRR